MTARIQNTTSQPDITTGVQHLFKAVYAGGVPPQTLELVHLRASQINGCSFCVDACATSATKSGVSPEKLLTLAAWYEDPRFDDAERAALALTEAATRLADRSDPIPEGVWEEAARHYDESALAGLVVAIAAINAWNRVNAATRQVTGNWVDQWIAPSHQAEEAA